MSNLILFIYCFYKIINKLQTFPSDVIIIKIKHQKGDSL